MKRKAKRLLSLLLAFTLVLQSLPASVLTVNATRAPETVSVTTVPSGVGTAARAEAGEEYYFEASVNKTYDASFNGTGYKFWKFTYQYDGMSLEESKDNPLTLLKKDGENSLKVDDVKALYSYVYKDTSRVITVRINGDGKVSLKKDNDIYEFTAEPAEGYNFVDLAVPEGVEKTYKEANSVAFTVDSSKIADDKDFVITANFEEGYKLKVDGELVSQSNTEGNGWKFSPVGTLVLDGYNGGSIKYTGADPIMVVFKGDNNVAGEISAANALTLAGEEDGAKLTASLIKAETVTFNSGKVNVLSENGCAITGIVNVKKDVKLTAETKLKDENAKAIDGSVNNAITGKGITRDNKTYSIAVTDGTVKGLNPNFVKVEFADHIHNFTYKVNSATVTADCSANGCALTEKKVTLTIKAPAHKTYGDGLSANATLEGLDKFNAATGLDIKADSIEYYYYSDASENELKAAPTDAGSYKAKISVSGDGIAKALVASVSYNIERANATVSAADAEKIYGDADPEFTYEVTGLVSGDNAEMIKVTSIGRKKGEDAGDYAIIPRGKFEQGNYKVSYSSGTLTIKQAPVTVSADNASKKFAEEDPEFTWTASGIKNGENAKALLVVDLTRDPGESVGTYDIFASGASSQGNYKVSYAKGKFTISENDVLFTAPEAIEGLSFNGAAQELVTRGGVSSNIGSLQYTLSDNGAEAPVNAEWSEEIPTATDAGTYYVWYRIKGNNDNYKVIEPKCVEVTIEKAVVTVYAVDTSKTYGDNDPAFSAKVLGLKNKDTISYNMVRAEGEEVKEEGYEISFGNSETEQGNYEINYVPAKFTILPAKVTVTAEDKTVSYGDADAELTWKVTGLKNNDQKSVLTVSVSRAEGTDAGVYAITPSGEEKQGNYAVKYVDGKYTITTAPAVITLVSANKTYGDIDPEFEWNVDGLKNFDTKETIAGAVTIIREPGEDVGEYAILAFCAKAAGNYSLTVGNTAKLTIEKKVVKVTGGITSNSKYYDGTTAAELNTTDATVEGVVNNDVIGVSAKGEFSNAKASADINGDYVIGDKKIVNIKDIALTGEKADNYSLSSNGNQTESTNYIFKAPLTIKAVANSKKYGDTDPEFKYTYEGIVSADKAENGTLSENVITGELARVIGEEVGEYDILRGTLAAANYHINFTGAKFTIVKSNEIAPAVSVQGWTYGGFDAEINKPEVTGNFGEGAETYFYKAENDEEWKAWDVEAVAILPAGKYLVSANVAETANYGAGYTADESSFIVEQRQLGVEWSDTALTYNGKVQKPSATVTGTVSDDQVGVTVTGGKTNAGSYVATAADLTGEKAASYKLLPSTTVFTIGKAKATVSAGAASKIYGTEDPEFTISVNGMIGEDTLVYEVSREPGENVGKYDILVTVSENKNYEVKVTGEKLTIEKAAPVVSVKPVAKKHLIFNGEAQELIEEGATNHGVMYYAVSTTEYAPVISAFRTAIPEATDAGTYYVWYGVRGDDNHTNTVVAEAVKVVIEVAAAVEVKPSAVAGLIENDAEQELVQPGTVITGTIKYAISNNDKEVPETGWSTEIPKAEKAGIYYVWYYVEDEATGTATPATCLTVVISQDENKTPKKSAENAKLANRASVDDTAVIVPSANGKTWTLDASYNEASGNELTLKATFIAGAKITLAGYNKDYSRQFKKFNKASRLTATVNNKGLLKAKKAGNGVIKYAMTDGKIVTLYYKVVRPTISVERGASILVNATAPGAAGKLKASYSGAGAFDVRLIGVPLNATYTFSGNKVLSEKNIVIGNDGDLHITGEIGARETARINVIAQGKKYTVRVVGKFK